MRIKKSKQNPAARYIQLNNNTGIIGILPYPFSKILKYKQDKQQMNRLILCVIITNHLLGLQDLSCSTSLFPALYPILSPMNPNSGEAGKLANGTSPVSSYSQLFRISFPICLLNHLWYIKLRSDKAGISSFLYCIGF